MQSHSYTLWENRNNSLHQSQGNYLSYTIHQARNKIIYEFQHNKTKISASDCHLFADENINKISYSLDMILLWIQTLDTAKNNYIQQQIIIIRGTNKITAYFKKITVSCTNMQQYPDTT